MYTMMIVEDEPWIRRGLEKILPWEEFNINYAGYASNGEEAVELFEVYQPDIIITDIKMPKMDGISLLKKIEELMPPMTQVIILTGYNDFQFVKEAIKYSVADYILKPVDRNELENTILKVTNKINVDREKNQQLLRLQIGNSLYEHLIIPADSPDVGIELPYDYNRILVSIDPFPEQILPHHGHESAIFSFSLGYSTVSIVSFSSIEEAEYFPELGKVESPLACAFGLSQIFHNNCVIKEAFIEAQIDLQKKLRKKTVVDDAETTYTMKLEQERELLTSLQNGDRTTIIRCMEEWIESSSSFNQQWAITFQIYTVLVRCLSNDQIVRQSSWLYRFKAANNKGDLYQIIQEMILPMVDEIMEHWNRSSYDIVAKSQEYMNLHFANPSLSLTMVAEQFMVSPSYLSYIFKNELQINFVSYLTEKRIEKAKEKLLSTKEQVYLISESVGFNDVKYFIRVFKRMTGFTPKQFREKMKRLL